MSDSTAKFSSGHVVITAAAKDVLHPEDVQACLARHLNGDWGDLCDADRDENQIALLHGLRLFSVYHDRETVKFYIITEHDRSVTTVLLPEDY